MKSGEFMSRLSGALGELPQEERDAALGYYQEYFADAADEERAVIKLGTPEDVAKTILTEYREQNQSTAPSQWAPPKTAKKKYINDNNRFLVIIILVLLSPIWVPIALGAAGVAVGLGITVIAAAFTLFISAAAVILTLMVTGFALFFGGIALVVISVGAFIHLAVADAVFLLGSGLVIMAVGAIFAVLFTWALIKVVPALISWFVDLCKLPFKNRNGRVAA